MITWKKREGGGEDNWVGIASLSASYGIPGNGHGLVDDGVYLIDRVMGSFCVAHKSPDHPAENVVVTWLTNKGPESIKTLGWARVIAHEHHQVRALAREKMLRARYEEAKAKRPHPKGTDDDYVPG